MTTLDIWADEFKPEIVALAKERVLEGGNLATGRGLQKRTIKLALILVRLLNPPDNLSEAETAILMGVTAPTLRNLKCQKEFIEVINR